MNWDPIDYNDEEQSLFEHEDMLSREGGIEIHEETFEKDFDEIDFDGTVADDSDQREAERYGL